MQLDTDNARLLMLPMLTLYLSRCFHRCSILQQKLNNFYPIFLAGNVQWCETVLKQFDNDVRAWTTYSYEQKKPPGHKDI